MKKSFTRLLFSAGKLLCSLVLPAVLFCGQESQAAVNWRLHAGGMYAIRGVYTTDGDGSNFNAIVGMEIQFPIRDKFFIETGLNLRVGSTTFTEGYLSGISFGSASTYKVPLKDFDRDGKYIGSMYENAYISQHFGYFFDIPLRFSYRYRLKGDNELQFAFGPYVEVYCDGNNYNGNNPVSVGLTPCVVYKHRALSLGAMYQNPCIYNGIENRDTNVLMFTIGVNFNGRKVNLDNVINGLNVASSIIGAANQTIAQYNEARSGSSYDSDSDSDNSYSSSSSSSASSRNSGTSLSKSRSAQTDRNTYFKNETIVQRILSGDDNSNKKNDIQRKMRKLRQKWSGTPYEWQASEWENK